MKLYQGRPKTAEGREEKEMKVYDLLDSLDIDYVRADHEAVMTIEACKEVDEALEIESARICFFATGRKQHFISWCCPAGNHFRPRNCRSRSRRPGCPLHPGMIWSGSLM